MADDFISPIGQALSGLDNSVNIPSYNAPTLRGFQAPTPIPISGVGNWNLTGSDLSPSSPQSDQGASSNSGSSFWDHPFTNLLEGNYPLAGALKGAVNALGHLDDPSYLQNYDNLDPSQRIAPIPLSHVWDSIVQGWNNPMDAIQTQQQGLQTAADAQGWNNLERGGASFATGAMSDPLSYIPIGKVAQGIKYVSDAANITPFITKGLDAINDSKLIQNPFVQGTKDAIGSRFVKNYDASPELNSILQSGEGEQAFHDVNNLNALNDLQQAHGLTPDELNNIGHVTEKTIQGTPEQQTLAQALSSLLENGATNSGIGSDLLSKTASAVNGEPLLAAKLTDYFPHIYNNVPDELKGVFPSKAEGVSGLSPNGTYNLPRTFSTLQDAIQQGLKPELNPFVATGQRLNQMSKAYVNNNIIDQIKKTPGLLFDKDPIDEAAKLVKTGRMTTEQAAQSLGMSVNDMKKGFVQSKIPQLRGAYIRPADEAALTEYLNPSRPSGIFGAVNKANNLYNKGFLLNPIPHLHNVSVNGMLLGEAKPSYVKEAFNGGKNDPWYLRTVKAGAINNPIEGTFAQAITKQAPTNIFSKGRKLSHDVLWNTDSAIRTALFREAVEKGMTDAEAAAHTNKFMVNYNNLTPFEKQYIKPLVPFYSWKKGNIPLQASQMIAQTPKYAIYNHAKDGISQAWSGLPTDQKGRIQTNDVLSDGSRVAVDMYNPMDEIGKIAEKGIVPWAFNSLNPFLREGIAQGTSAAGAFFPQTGLQNKFPIYNSGAPADYNVRSGLSHALSNLNPLGGSAIAGEFINPKEAINTGLGLPNKQQAPGEASTELITKLLGGFTGRDNPQKDALNQRYQNKDDAQNQIKYLKQNGQPVPKGLKKQAYQRIKPVPIPINQSSSNNGLYRTDLPDNQPPGVAYINQ